MKTVVRLTWATLLFWRYSRRMRGDDDSNGTAVISSEEATTRAP